MTYTYDPTTDVGRIRRTIPDKDDTESFWSDEELQSFLIDEGDWRRATAACLETMAADDLLVLKAIKIHNIETRVDKVAESLMKRAALLREQAVLAEANDGDSWDIAEQTLNDFGFREKITDLHIKELL